MQEHFKTTFETEIEAPLEKVWEALTSPEILKQYFFGTEMITTWEVGTPITFQGSWEGQAYMDKGTVLAYTNNDFLSYSYLSSWADLPDLPENYLHITYKVEPSTTGTKLTITQTNYDEERAKHSSDNWAGMINEMKKIIC